MQSFYIFLFAISFAQLTIAAPPAVIADLKEKQDKAWKDLQTDKTDKTRAILFFSGTPKQTIAFFKTKLQPLILEKETAEKLLEDLGSDDKNVWAKAYEKFSYYDFRLALSLPEIFPKLSPEQTERIVALCFDYQKYDEFNLTKGNAKWELSPVNEGYNFRNGNSSYWAEHRVANIGVFKKIWNSTATACVILESFGTAEAIEILQLMATGHAEATPTIAAKEALKNLNVKEKK